MPPATLVKQDEVTLSVTSPPINNNISETIQVDSGSGPTLSKWSVVLTRQGSSLHIDARWSNGTSWLAFPWSSSAMYVFPRFETAATTRLNEESNITLSSGSGYISLQREIEDADRLMVNGQYDFDIVLSTGKSLARTPIMPSLKRINNILQLLKDPHSVDTCFVFPSDSAYSNIGLWAHRSILSSYKSFEKLIHESPVYKSFGEKEIEVESLGSSCDSSSDILTEQRTAAAIQAGAATVIAAAEARTLIIKVEGHSLATMCALLYFVYTDDIELAIDTSQYMISNSKSSLVWYDNSTGKIHDSIRWSPFDHSSPWKLKDVTWSDLLRAANHFEIEDLATRCRPEVIKRLSRSNVVNFFFTSDPDAATTMTAAGNTRSLLDLVVKEAAGEFILKKMNYQDVNSLNDFNNPLAPFKHHADFLCLLKKNEHKTVPVNLGMKFSARAVRSVDF